MELSLTSSLRWLKSATAASPLARMPLALAAGSRRQLANPKTVVPVLPTKYMSGKAAAARGCRPLASGGGVMGSGSTAACAQDKAAESRELRVIEPESPGVQLKIWGGWGVCECVLVHDQTRSIILALISGSGKIHFPRHVVAVGDRGVFAARACVPSLSAVVLG